MAEYIDREAALIAIKVHCPAKYEAEMLARIVCIPAADVVEVVRCKECKHRDDDNFCAGRGWPEQLVPEDGYCDKGARKDGDNDGR